jgi:uncharacterized membrane protein/CheY-like chemotaxis protein
MIAVPLAMLFATPLAALATLAGAASIPVVIHLLNRRRFRVVDWAAMRFLLAARRQNVRRLRLEQLLLLTVRTLLIVLLIAAMCGITPWAEAIWQRWLPGTAIGGPAVTGRTHKVIVIDGSLSMTVAGERGTCFDRAKALAAELVRTSAAGDGFSVVLMAAPVQAVVPGPAEDASRVAAEVEGLRCPHGNADLGGALQLVDELVRKAPGKYAQREVYVVSDLQRSTWASGSPGSGWTEAWSRLQAQAQVVVLDVGRPDVDNLAVTALTIADPLAITGTRTTLTATVRNLGTKERTGVKVELLVNPRGADGGPIAVVQQELLTFPAGGSTAVTFPYEFRSAGDHVFQVRIENDALEADDSRSLTVTARDTLPVLVVNGKPAADRYDQAASWLADALFPFPESVRHPAYPARPKVIDTARFADPGASDLSAYDCVFLCDVPRLSEREVARLETHLQRGGGLVICLGPDVDLEAYNRLLFQDGKGLLPGKLIGVAQAPADGLFTPVADEEAYQRPPLTAFAGDDERASLMSARFKQYVRVQAPPGSAARRLLGLAPNFTDRPKERPAALGAADPLILEWPRHRGRVVLVTSTVNTDWTSWPIAPSFPPFVQELFRFAVLQPPRRTLNVGDAIEELLPPSVIATEAIVHTPDGRSESVPLRAEPNATRLRFADTDQSGLYRVSISSPRRDVVFAVNVPPPGPNGGESDLRRISPDELTALTPGEDVQIVPDLGAIRRTPKRPSSEPESADSAQSVAAPRGPGLARWLLFAVFVLLVAEVVLAWRFGSARSGPTAAIDQPADTLGRRRLDRLLGVLAAIPLLAVAIGGALLVHAAWTDDALGFLPAEARRSVEAAFGVPPASAGEGTRWRLEYLPYLTGEPRTDRWLAGAAGLAAIVLAAWVYRRELARSTNPRPSRLALVGLRTALFVMTLGLLLPQVRLLFEREGWPDLVLLIDDSQSMSHVDDYQDPAVKSKVLEMAGVAKLPAPQRLALAQALVTRSNAAWLDSLVARQAKLHVFHCSSRVERLAQIDSAAERVIGADAVRGLKPTGPSSALGTAVRTVLQEFRGSALAGIVMFTDGVTTDGDDLVLAAQHASKSGVPLYFVGVGDAHEPRDLILHDLQVEDAVHVQDRLVFEVRVTAKGGLQARTVPVTLSEKIGDQLKELAREEVALDPAGKPVKVRLTHTPTAAGEREYVIAVPAQPDETDTSNNRLTRRIYVAEFQRTRVLYVEGYPRYEYRFLKTLLERESAATRANKTIDLKVLLADADPDYAKEDRSAVEGFPAMREDLFNRYDLVILGDVDPRHPMLGEKHMQWLADFVREKGGGLLLIAGGQFLPQAYRDTPLADVLPVEVSTDAADDRDRSEGYRLQLTPAGRMNPLFRFVPDEADNQAIWDRLTPMYWSAGPLKPKPAAEVLAERPAVGSSLPEPLTVQHFAGAGRAMLFGFDESWRWRLREDEGRYNQFWIQAVKYLARTRLGRTELRTDKQVPYRQGEPIRITVRFPDDVPPPDAKAPVQVTSEYIAPNGEVEAQTLKLAKLSGSRATYEAVLTRTSQGEYKFWLAAPTPSGAKPQTAAKVLPPPGEMDRLQMNRADLERAALVSRGRFYTLADADRLPAELPPLPRVTLNQPRPPWPLWNHPAVFGLALALLTGEWLLRKRRQLL